MVAAYVDEHVTEVAVNLLLAQVHVVLDTGEEVTIPLATVQDASLELAPMFPAEASLDAANAAVPAEWRQAIEAQGMTVCVFYHGPGGVIWPSVLNQQTLPRLHPTYRAALEAARADAQRTAETAADLALWYLGARVAGLRVRRAPGEPTPPGPAAAPPLPFNAAAMADELATATSSMRSAGQQMLEAGKRLSAMGDLTAQQKVDVMLEFFKRINFAIDQRGVVTEAGALAMYSDDGVYAFRFLTDTGKILYGKFAIMEGVWTWTPL